MRKLKTNNRDFEPNFKRIRDSHTARRRSLSLGPKSSKICLLGASCARECVCVCVISSENGGLLLLLTGPTPPPAYLPSAEGRAQQVAHPDIRLTLSCFLPACLPAFPNYSTPSFLCESLVACPFSCLLLCLPSCLL